MEVVAYIDGGARGNPGPAGYGVRIEQPDGTLVEEFWESIGVATNNVAEYRGLLAALEWARAHDLRDVRVRSDSQLLVQQMLGNYKVKHPVCSRSTPGTVIAHDSAACSRKCRRVEPHSDLLANAAMMKKPLLMAPVDAAVCETIAPSNQDVRMARRERRRVYLGARHAGLRQLFASGRPAIEEPPVGAPRPADD